MPQAFGWGNAMRYLLTGDEFDAQEALRLGLVQEVIPVGQQLERAVAWQPKAPCGESPAPAP